MPEPVEPKRAPKGSTYPLPEGRVPTWTVLAPRDHRLEDVLHPGYLAERVKDVRKGGIPAGSIVLIASEAHAFLVELYIRGVDRDAQAVQAIVLRVIDLTEAEVLSTDWAEAEVVDMGEPHHWVVKLGHRTARTGFKNRGQGGAGARLGGPSQTDARAWQAARAVRAFWHRRPCLGV